MNLTAGQVQKCKQMLAIAQKEIGITETPGNRSTARIVEYLRTTTLDRDDANKDETPWCSAFACWVGAKAGLKTTRSAMARSWLKWGVETKTPIPGAIVVFRRGAPPSGHVAFVLAVRGDAVEVVGGNQGDGVCKRRYLSTLVLGYRIPAAEDCIATGK